MEGAAGAHFTALSVEGTRDFEGVGVSLDDGVVFVGHFLDAVQVGFDERHASQTPRLKQAGELMEGYVQEGGNMSPVEVFFVYILPRCDGAPEEVILFPQSREQHPCIRHV